MASEQNRDSTSDHCESDDSEGDGAEEAWSGDPSEDDEDGDGDARQWHCENSGLREIPFTGSGGLNVPPPGGNKPTDYFYMLLDEVFLQTVIETTNKCAHEMVSQKPSARSRISKWKDLTVQELKLFLALVYHTGSIRLDRLTDYWKKDFLFNMTFFREHMPRDRFLLIWRCLNFSKARDLIRLGDTGKVVKLVEFFNKKMKQVYSPSRELCVDEPAILTRGIVVCGKHKEVQCCVRMFSLSEPCGLILNFLVGGGRGKRNTDNVVLNLVKDYSDKGHSLYVDSYYDSISAATLLLSKNTYCTGIIDPEWPNIPRAVKDAELETGGCAVRYSDGVLVGKCQHQRAVLYLSTEHDNEIVCTVNSHGKFGGKPLPIIKHDATMNAVDRSDQLFSFYPLQQTGLSWYKKVFVHVLQMFMVNSWLLHGIVNKDDKMDFYSYRLLVIKSLLPPATPSTSTSVPRALKRPVNHVLSITDKRGPKNKRMLKRCRMCNMNGVRKQCVYFCAECPEQPGLCAVGCFEQFHLMNP